MFHCFFLLRLLQFFDVLFWPLPRWKPHLKTAGPNRWNRWSDREAKPMDSNKAVRSIIKFDLIFCFCLFYFFWFTYWIGGKENMKWAGRSNTQQRPWRRRWRQEQRRRRQQRKERQQQLTARRLLSAVGKEGGGRGITKKTNQTKQNQRKKGRKEKENIPKRNSWFLFFSSWCFVVFVTSPSAFLTITQPQPHCHF